MRTEEVIVPPLTTSGSADQELAATLYVPEWPRDRPGGTGARRTPGLVVGHGAGSRRTRHQEFCREACSQGFVVLALDLRGHGESPGVADGPLERDVLAAVAFLRSRTEVDGARLCFRGSSMGGFYGLKAAALADDFVALALLCPASEQVMLDGLGETEAGQVDTISPGPTSDTGPDAARWDLPRMRAYFETQDSLALASRVRRPVLLVHARGDDTVPIEHSLALAAHLAGDTTVLCLAGGSHTSAQHDRRIHRLTVRWLLDQVTSACIGRT